MKNISKICIVCGEKYIKPKSCGLPEWFGCERRPLGRRFCSKECSNKYKEGQSSWNKDIPWTDDQREKIVRVKKGKHYSPKTEFQKGDDPWNKDKKGVMPIPWNKDKEWKEMQGVNHPNWKGGATKLGQLIRSQRIYFHWRSDVFKRDNWTCQHCGAKRKKGDRVILHCDHIKPFYKILEENQIKTVEQAKQCKELWDITNGRTLCISCHKQTPSYLINQHTL